MYQSRSAKLLKDGGHKDLSAHVGEIVLVKPSQFESSVYNITVNNNSFLITGRDCFELIN